MLINLACLDGKNYAEYKECRIYCGHQTIAEQAKEENADNVELLDMRSHVKTAMVMVTCVGGVWAAYQNVQDPFGPTLLNETGFMVYKWGSNAWKIGATLFQ